MHMLISVTGAASHFLILKMICMSHVVYLYHFRECLVDLIGRPGYLCEPDSLLNGPSSISISSPLRFPRLKPVEPIIDFRSLAKQYFSDCESLNLVFDEASLGNFLVLKAMCWHQ